jgi:hypothetical protein
MMSRPRPNRPTPTVPLLGLAAVAAVTCASALWLHQSSLLATTGQRIYELDLERQALMERRAAALVAYAAATDPRRLEDRARALGLAPSPATEPLVMLPGVEVPPEPVVAADSPLAITGATVSALPAEPTLTERLLSMSLSAASASERAAPAAVGGIR